MNQMKKILTLTLVGYSAMALLTGCAWQVGSSAKTTAPTTGQQLIDLKKAKDSGAISDSEYETQKAKILNGGK